MSGITKFFSRVNCKTIYFNLKYLPLGQAVKLPILISRRVNLREMKGTITINAPIRTGLIQIGFGNVGIFDKRSRSVWQVAGDVTFNGKANIGHGSKISVGKSGKLTIGKNFVITAETAIASHESITIGDNCLFSWESLIMDTDFHTIKDDNGTVLNDPEPITIGDNTWIGCRCSILKGSNIPNGTILGANSLVSTKLEQENCLYGGSPARLMKENISWEQ